MKRAILLTKNKLPKRIARLLTNVTCYLVQGYGREAIAENTARLVEIGYDKEVARIIITNVARKLKKKAIKEK